MAFGIVLVAGVFAPEFVFAQSRQDAQVVVRVQDLEETVRTLTGQVEGLQFQLTQMQQLIQKMQDDNEFRFQQLEGGAGKKTDAATHSDGVMPSGALPQAHEGAHVDDQAAGGPPADSFGVGQQAAPAAPSDELGDSADPLLNGSGSGELGTLPEDLNGRPLDLTLSKDQPVSDGDAQAQYKAGYDAITRGDYAFAEDQFRQFIALYPKDAEAPDAANWLGEALLQRQAYDEAADVLLTGFQNYQTSTRAPDLLLKLGIALAGAGEADTACRTFAEVQKRYPTQSTAFNQRLAAEKQKVKCPT